MLDEVRGVEAVNQFLNQHVVRIFDLVGPLRRRVGDIVVWVLFKNFAEFR